MNLIAITIRILLRSLALFTPEAAHAEVPVYVYSPCITKKDSEPTLNATAFADEMKAAGFEEVEHDGKLAWNVDYRIKRTMIYRYVGEFGEATCVVEVDAPPKP